MGVTNKLEVNYDEATETWLMLGKGGWLKLRTCLH